MIVFVFHSPASVVTVRSDSVAFKYILRFSEQSENVTREYIKARPTSSSETLSTMDRPQSAPKSEENTLIDVRKEKYVGVGVGPILAQHPQISAPKEPLPPAAKIHIP